MNFTDTIRVVAIQFEANHGAFAPERKQKRRFECDIEIRTNTSRAGRTDRLADTVDYGFLCETAVRVGTEKTYKLLEKLAAEIAIVITARYPTLEVCVEIRKLLPPCIGKPTYSAVRVVRGPQVVQTPAAKAGRARIAR